MSGLEGKSYYEILGVSKTATTEEIKKAYKDVAQAFHPDSNFYSEIIEEIPSPDNDDAFKVITSAYTTLVNKERRQQYDETLAPDLRGWTETELRVPHEDWDVSSQDAAQVPYAWGTFGKVEQAPAPSAFDTHSSDVRAVSEMVYNKRESWFARLCWFFGL